MKNIFKKLNIKPSIKHSSNSNEGQENSLNIRYNYTLCGYYQRYNLNEKFLGESTSFHIPFYGTMKEAQEQAWNELRKSVAFEVARGANFQAIKDSVNLNVKAQFSKDTEKIPCWVPSHRDIVKYLESPKTRREFIREKYDRASKIVSAAWKRCLPQKGM